MDLFTTSDLSIAQERKDKPVHVVISKVIIVVTSKVYNWKKVIIVVTLKVIICSSRIYFDCIVFEGRNILETTLRIISIEDCNDTRSQQHHELSYSIGVAVAHCLSLIATGLQQLEWIAPFNWRCKKSELFLHFVKNLFRLHCVWGKKYTVWIRLR